MIAEILGLLTPGGRRSLVLSIVGFVLYALTGVAMSLLALGVLSGLIAGSGTALPVLWGLLVLCLLIKGGTNILADVQKHYAGFDVVLQLRRRIVRRLKTFSLGFYTNERLGEIGVII
ncbi:MAG: ABC transporter ATP-binding protein, partial [Fretibacterium sp.]|nr:ABC transporter ATP-binding protein [Fretibacterium sp.]